jgi:PTS system nitrogen regulatory IIA component
MELTIRDAAAIFDVPEARIYRWVHEDDLPARNVNGQLYFNRTELLEWAAIRRVGFASDLFRDPSGGATSGEGLVEALRSGGIFTGLTGSDKGEILRGIVASLRLPEDFDRPTLLELFVSREAAGSTAVGDGIAIPHPRHPVITPAGRPTLTLFFLEKPIDFGAPDRQPVHTLFVLVSPTIRAHLRMLARVACVLRDEQFRAVLRRRGSTEEILREVQRLEDSADRRSSKTGESA